MPRSKTFDYEPYGAIPAGIENAAVSDNKTFSGVKGFIADISGTLAVDMADGSSGTIPVVAGIQYAGQITKFKSSGTTGVTSVAIFY
jgi:hypothetical protein